MAVERQQRRPAHCSFDDHLTPVAPADHQPGRLEAAEVMRGTGWHGVQDPSDLTTAGGCVKAIENQSALPSKQGFQQA